MPSDQTAPPDPRRRSDASHAAILAATVELLEEGGYRALTIEGVARRAGVGKQTIYRWWDGSKAALVLEAFSEDCPKATCSANQPTTRCTTP